MPLKIHTEAIEGLEKKSPSKRIVFNLRLIFGLRLCVHSVLLCNLPVVVAPSLDAKCKNASLFILFSIHISSLFNRIIHCHHPFVFSHLQKMCFPVEILYSSKFVRPKATAAATTQPKETDGNQRQSAFECGASSPGRA